MTAIDVSLYDGTGGLCLRGFSAVLEEVERVNVESDIGEIEAIVARVLDKLREVRGVCGASLLFSSAVKRLAKLSKLSQTMDMTSLARLKVAAATLCGRIRFMPRRLWAIRNQYQRATGLVRRLNALLGARIATAQ